MGLQHGWLRKPKASSELMATPELGPAFWDELAADAKFSDQVPCLRHAILKLACSGQVITPANLKKVFGKDGFCKAQSADAVIRKLRDVLSENGLDIMADPRLLNLMGVTEINIARMVLGMASPAQEKPMRAWKLSVMTAFSF